MSVLEQKLEEIWSGLSETARKRLLEGKITIKDARLLSGDGEVPEQDIDEWFRREKASLDRYVRRCQVSAVKLDDLTHLLEDLRGWQEINTFAVDLFMQGDMTLEQMRMAAKVRMGRRSARMFSEVNDRQRVERRRRITRELRKLCAEKRRLQPRRLSAIYNYRPWWG